MLAVFVSLFLYWKNEKLAAILIILITLTANVTNIMTLINEQKIEKIK